MNLGGQGKEGKSYIVVREIIVIVVAFRAAAMTLRTVLLSLQALLSAAEPDDPQDAVVAKQYKDAPEMFRLTARHWTAAYAGGGLYFNLFYNLFQFRINEC